MTNRDQLIELLAQTLAPRLYQLCGERPEEMGFPIADSKEAFDDRVARQFDPVNYWLTKGREIGASIVCIIEAGGANAASIDIQAALDAAAKERPDIKGDAHLSMDELVPPS